MLSIELFGVYTPNLNPNVELGYLLLQTKKQTNKQIHMKRWINHFWLSIQFRLILDWVPALLFMFGCMLVLKLWKHSLLPKILKVSTEKHLFSFFSKEICFVLFFEKQKRYLKNTSHKWKHKKFLLAEHWQFFIVKNVCGYEYPIIQLFLPVGKTQWLKSSQITGQNNNRIVKYFILVASSKLKIPFISHFPNICGGGPPLLQCFANCDNFAILGISMPTLMYTEVTWLGFPSDRSVWHFNILRR